jgi:hypothetical protein
MTVALQGCRSVRCRLVFAKVIARLEWGIMPERDTHLVQFSASQLVDVDQGGSRSMAATRSRRTRHQDFPRRGEIYLPALDPALGEEPAIIRKWTKPFR